MGARHVVSGSEVSFIDVSGVVKSLPVNIIHMISYVTDFNPGNLRDPEKLGRRAFLARPRDPGLWLRITFSDASILEGLAAPDLRLAEDFAIDGGVFLRPPDPRSNAHRVFVPHIAMASLEILAVIGAASKNQSKAKGTSSPQPNLFDPS